MRNLYRKKHCFFRKRGYHLFHTWNLLSMYFIMAHKRKKSSSFFISRPIIAGTEKLPLPDSKVPAVFRNFFVFVPLIHSFSLQSLYVISFFFLSFVKYIIYRIPSLFIKQSKFLLLQLPYSFHEIIHRFCFRCSF